MSDPVFFNCDYDGNPMRVSVNGDGGVVFSIGDTDNDQSKQVRLSPRDQKALAEMLCANIARSGASRRR